MHKVVRRHKTCYNDLTRYPEVCLLLVFIEKCCFTKTHKMPRALLRARREQTMMKQQHCPKKDLFERILHWPQMNTNEIQKLIKYSHLDLQQM